MKAKSLWIAWCFAFSAFLISVPAEGGIFGNKEKKAQRKAEEQAIQNLPPDYRLWLEKVSFIITPEERTIFLTYDEDWQRDNFIEREFWERRPRGFRERYESRIEEAIRLFGFKNFKNDQRAKMYIFNGPPDAPPDPIERVDCGGEFVPIQIWHYSHLEDIMGNVLSRDRVDFVFYCTDESCFGGWHLWVQTDGIDVLQKGFMRRVANPTLAETERGECYFQVKSILEATRTSTNILGEMGQNESRIHGAPSVVREGLARIPEYSTTLSKGAVRVDLQNPMVRFVYDPRKTMRVSLGIYFMLRNEDFKAEARSEEDGKLLYHIDAIHAYLVWRDGKHQVHVKPAKDEFNLPFDNGAQGIPIALREERLLPGNYYVVIRVVDKNSPLVDGKVDIREGLWKGTVVVPSVADVQSRGKKTEAGTFELWERLQPSILPVKPGEKPPELLLASEEEAGGVEGVVASEEGLTTEEIAEAIKTDGQPEVAPAPASPRDPEADLPPIFLVPIDADMVVGLQRFEAKTTSAVRRVEFYLDDQLEFSREAPFTVELRMGNVPRRHEVKVVAYDAAGEYLSDYTMVVNEAHRPPFDIQIVSPAPRALTSGPTKIQALVSLGREDALEKVELYLNENLLATLTKSPFVAKANIPRGEVVEIRAVATLKGGRTSFDSRIVNLNTGFSDEIKVTSVELCANVLDGKKRPVEGLSQGDFKVFENDKPQTLVSFELVRNVPVTIGIAVDISASTETVLRDATRAGVDFILSMLDSPEDKGFTMGIGEAPYLYVDPTNDRERLLDSVVAVRSQQGMTSFYDGIVAGLYQFQIQGIKGKRAIVVLTDGEDTSSEFTFEEVLEYARKSDVSVYAISFDISKLSRGAKQLQTLTEATGGQLFIVSADTTPEERSALNRIREKKYTNLSADEWKVIEKISERRSRKLVTVYGAIERDLRSQYCLAYNPTAPDTETGWRSIEVVVNGPGYTFRAKPGYYP